ncbi:hypothetical protein MSAN_02352500 [Mycena sanguinolenta]|uniref:Uncharacterized protein n=1 Tax=Mycena sanguinolenta TaxID=230812 RepID=A0A8H6X645_9AGAR|nr:hypothetical protein MSAN_02352500 [Mycena sanguinolenta]
MGNALSTPIVLGAISLIPYNRYVLWGLCTASLVLYLADGQRPSSKLGLLEASIDSVGKILESANKSCTRNYVELIDARSEFYEVKLSGSNIKYRLLETHDISTWNEFVEYVRYSMEMWQSIRQYEKELKEIKISILRIVEAERQRELSEDIQTFREIISSSTHRPFAVNRRVRSSARVYAYESISV